MLAPLQPRFELAVARHELELDAGQRQPDIAGVLGFPGAGERGRRGFGRAEAGDEDDALAGGLDRKLLQFVAHVLRQARAGIEHDFEPAEEAFAQRGVAAQIRQQHLKALRHVEIDRRRDVAQIAHGRLDGARQRLAFVDIERAAIVEHHAEIVVAAEGVVPRRPVDQHRRLVGE